MADFKVLWNNQPTTVIRVGGLVLSLSIAFLYGLWLLNT